MAVVLVATMQMKPGGMDALMERMRKGKALTEGFGARNARALSSVVGGEATGTVTFTFEVDDFAQFGAVMDKVMTDPQMAEMMAMTSDSPNGQYQTSVWMDLL
jgi:hypothetical protein